MNHEPNPGEIHMSFRCRTALAAVLTAVFVLSAGPAWAKKKHEVTVETLLQADETILGQEFAYPEGTPEITIAVLTVPPHATIPLHEHPVPLAAYILQGELVIDYEGVGEIRYREGDAFVEAFEVPHQARNGGRGKVKILAIYSGAVGVPNAISLE